MGLATIDPHHQKEHTEIHKIPKFGVNQASLTEIQRFENVKIYKEMYGHPDAVRHSLGIAIHFFVNFQLYSSQNSDLDNEQPDKTEEKTQAKNTKKTTERGKVREMV